MKIILNYNELENEIYKTIGNKKIMVVATSYNNRVTARNLSCIIYDKKIYFQSDRNFLKCEQIINNPNVALCIDNIQIEGIAKLIGHPLAKENNWFKEIYKESYPSSYQRYSNMKDEIIVEVVPKFITLYKYENNLPLRDFLDIKKQEAYRENYIIK